MNNISGAFGAFNEEMARAKEAMRVGEAPDVERVRRLVGAMGQSFTTTIFAFQQVSTLKSNVTFLARLAGKYDEPWVRTVAEELFKSPLNTLRTRYQLSDTADLMEKAAALTRGLSNQEIVAVSRSFIEYLGFLARRIRDHLPFYELSIAFEGHKFMTERAVAPGRQSPNQGTTKSGGS